MYGNDQILRSLAKLKEKNLNFTKFDQIRQKAKNATDDVVKRRECGNDDLENG